MLVAGTPRHLAWLVAQLRSRIGWIVAEGIISKNKARKLGLIPNPYRQEVKF